MVIFQFLSFQQFKDDVSSCCCYCCLYLFCLMFSESFGYVIWCSFILRNYLSISLFKHFFCSTLFVFRVSNYMHVALVHTTPLECPTLKNLHSLFFTSLSFFHFWYFTLILILFISSEIIIWLYILSTFSMRALSMFIIVILNSPCNSSNICVISKSGYVDWFVSWQCVIIFFFWFFANFFFFKNWLCVVICRHYVGQ